MTVRVELADATANATVALAVVTMFLAVVTAWGAWLTRRTLRLTRESLKLTSESLEVSRTDSTELIKSRIDQRAPRIAVTGVQAGPSTKCWNRNTSTIEAVDPSDALDDDSAQIGLTGWIKLRNEGRSTAAVWLPAGVLRFAEDVGPLGFDDSRMQVVRPGKAQFALAPGEGTLLFIQVQQSLGFWKTRASLPVQDRGALSTSIIVADRFNEGIEDTTRVRFLGQPVSHIDEIWRAVPEVRTHMNIPRTVRKYPGITDAPSHVISSAGSSM
jgi:hypothetical protein